MDIFSLDTIIKWSSDAAVFLLSIIIPIILEYYLKIVNKFRRFFATLFNSPITFKTVVDIRIQDDFKIFKTKIIEILGKEFGQDFSKNAISNSRLEIQDSQKVYIFQNLGDGKVHFETSAIPSGVGSVSREYGRLAILIEKIVQLSNASIDHVNVDLIMPSFWNEIQFKHMQGYSVKRIQVTFIGDNKSEITYSNRGTMLSGNSLTALRAALDEQIKIW